MAFTVVAEPMERFQAWIAQQKAPAPEPGSDQERRGRELFLQSTCVTCHTIAGTTAQARVGPELTHVASRLTIAAGTLPNTADHLRAWVRDPPAIRPGVRMPASPFTPDELDAVIAYLRSLR
jgi:cytochrome c oxidase subunit 2